MTERADKHEQGKSLECGLQGSKSSALRSLDASLALNSLPHVQSSAISLFPGQNLWGPCPVSCHFVLLSLCFTLAFYFSLIPDDSFSNTKRLQNLPEILKKHKFLSLESESVMCVRYLGIFPSYHEFNAGCLGKKNKVASREDLKASIWRTELMQSYVTVLFLNGIDGPTTWRLDLPPSWQYHIKKRLICSLPWFLTETMRCGGVSSTEMF